MRRIAHISDLHFGADDPAVVQALGDWLIAAAPDLVVVSGDLSQRARRAQFAAADAFVRRLEAAGLALLVVPGNHDVPLHAPLARLFWPLRRYRRLFGARPRFYADAEVAVLGLSSAHGLTVKDGRLTRRQIARIERCLADSPREATRILVTHHPLVPLPRRAGEQDPALRGAERALAAVRRADVHIILAGHHHAHTVVLAGPDLPIDPALMVVQAGTATSVRRRGTPNSVNLLHIDGPSTLVEEWTSTGAEFTCARRLRFERRGATGWHPA
ncbi:metallophosphoesterase family protein [Sphingomonas morindae]|uniref:Metallophosphoesterase n=1 Tax=Sphingomonas morindae TaxID=1541170 RepID=A0ABY4XAP7_9SPHN|nr:metallophosphoesterase [Sphingomonas morindae]USI74037.1 metallophosphoesterase [Sphingomonas morindae]